MLVSRGNIGGNSTALLAEFRANTSFPGMVWVPSAPPLGGPGKFKKGRDTSSGAPAFFVSDHFQSILVASADDGGSLDVRPD